MCKCVIPWLVNNPARHLVPGQVEFIKKYSFCKYPHIPGTGILFPGMPWPCMAGDGFPVLKYNMLQEGAAPVFH